MKDSTLYTIGHGNKEIQDFIAELKSFKLDYLLDIRSKPFSKWNSQFNGGALAEKLRQNGIRYVFVGDTLGGLPDDRSCFDHKGKVIYDLIKQKDFFRQGLERLITAHNRGINLAIMCSETKPEQCHRSKLIGQELLKKNIEINHIVSISKVRSQSEIMAELTKGKGSVDLFGNETYFTSRKIY